MSATKHTIKIDAEVVTQLKGMNDVVAGLQKGLKEGATKVDLSKGVGASLSKSIAAFEKDYARILKLSEGGVIQLGDAKEFTKKGQHLLNIFEDLQRVIGNFDSMQLLDAKKLFPDAFDKKVSDLRASLTGLSEGFDKLSTKNMNKQKLEGEIKELEADIKTLQATASKEAEFKVSSDKAQAELKAANDKVAEIRESLKQEFKLKIDADLASEKEMKDKLKTMKEQFEQTKKNVEVDPSGKRVARYKGLSTGEWRRKKDSPDKTAALAALQQYEKEKKAIEELEEKIGELASRKQEMSKVAANIDNGDLTAAANALGKTGDEAKEVTDALQEQKTATEAAADAASDLAKAQKAAAEAGEKQTQLEAKQKKLASVLSDIEKLTKQTDLSGIITAFNKLNEELKKADKNTMNLDLTEETLKSEDGIEKLKAELDKLDQEDLNKLKAALKELGFTADSTKGDVKGVGQAFDGINDSAKTLTYAQREMENLKDSFLRFFSLTNTVQIFKNALKDAFDTVKELDAAMTETAVVTDFSIGDMWDKLPEYSEQATKLGASIKELYDATTLYYQQGLNSQQAMDVGIETMKMARIAGMDAAAATEAMTAALRGFNMEINEVSATRINDVYSELAAITASDTEQIATAMSKTASIASSANMEFETTAALLAQIIETTQEAPETAGTAMKTIIARFTEVKELFSEGMLTGEDSEGEEININKIDAALKTVGISLKDFLNGTKGIDDIFLELASKWDTLDLATQRYIATAAAGSRQQSRFLAMMSNYDRTMELVTAANNSAGASQKQFDKTTESLEAKLQRLKNAWDTFVMGLANSEVIKTGVDLLTNLLNVINNLTDAGEGKLGNLITTITRLTTVFLGLKTGQGLLNSFLKLLDKSGAAKIFGLNMADVGKVDFVGAMGGTFKTLSQTIAKYNNWDAVGDAAVGALTKIKNGVTVVLQPLKQFGALLGSQPGLWGKVKLVGSFALKGLLAGIKALFSPLSVLLISIAAITAAIIGIRKAYQEIENNFKLKQASAEISNLKEQANEAKNELEEIGAERSNLESLQNTFKNLTKGTDEWKQALVKVNQEVLGLIEKYPELQATIGKDGQLEIDSDSWDTLLKKQAQVMSNINAQILEAESRKQKIQGNINYEEFAVKVVEIREETEENKDYYTTQVETAKMNDALDQWLLNAFGEKFYENFVKISDSYVNQSIGKMNMANAIVGGEMMEYSDSSEGVKARIEGEDNYYENQAYEKIIGLTRKQIDDLAEYFAEQQLTDELSREQLMTGLQKIGLKDDELTSENEITEFANLFERILNDAEHPFYEYVAALQENTLAEKRLTAQFTTNAIGVTTVGNEDYADAIANVIANEISRSEENIDTINERVDKKVADIRTQYSDSNGKLDSEKIAAAYANIMGYQNVGSEVYTDGTYSQRVETSTEAMLRAIATEKVTVEIQEKSNITAAKIESKEEQQQRLFDDLLGGQDGSNITNAQRQKYFKNGEIDFNQLAQDFDIVVGAGEETFAKIAEDFGILPNEFKDMLQSNFEKSEIRAKKQRSSTANSIAQYATGTRLNAGNIYGTIEKIESNFVNTYSDIEVRDMLDSALSALSKTGDNKLIQNGIFELIDAGLENNVEKFTELSQFIDEVNWSDPVEAVSRLNREIKIGTGTSKEFAQNLMDMNSSFLGDASQFKSFLNSSEYSEISEKLAEIKETQGEITAADIDELASEYSYLNKMIKNTQMSSKSLASVLDDITDGAMAFEDINDVLIAGIKYLGSFEDSLDSILEYLNDFDPGRDEGEAQDFLDKAAKVVTERVENYEYGNTEARNYITELLGTDYLKGTTEEQVAAMDAAKTWLESITGSAGAGMQVFKNIADGKDIMGNTIAGGQQKIEGIDYGYNEQGKFYMDIDASKYKTLDEVTQAFADSNLGGAKTLWDTMFTLISNFDPGFAQDWEVEQAGQAGARMHEEAMQIDGKALVSEKTIKNTAEKLYEAVGDVTDKSVDDFVTDIKKGLEESGGYQTFDVLNVDGTRKDLQTLKSEIEALFGGLDGEDGLLSRYIGLNQDGISTFDFTGLSNGLQTLGLTAEESLEITYSYIQKLPEEVQKININGQEVNLFNTDGTKKSIDELKEEVESLKNAAEIESTVSINTAAATSKVRSYISELNAIPRNIVTSVSVEETGNTSNNSGETTNGGTTVNKSQMVVKAATGTINHPRSELALTGEEGPELVETEEGAYLVGMEGPQMAYINKGDTVHTAEETAEIYKRKGVLIKAYAQGQDGKISSILDLDKIIKGGSGGSSSDDDEETWENGFDKLYNLVRKIDEELRQRERIERRYEKLLESLNVSANKIISVSREELAQLERERMLQEALVSGRKAQISAYQSENSDLTKYANVVQNDRGEDVLRINWDLINSVTDTDEGDRIEEYISQLEEWFDDLEEAEDALWDIEDAVEEIKERGEEEYFDLEDAIKEALQQSYQDEIDKLSQINESINDTNSALLDAMQKSLDKQRQARDNQRTEDDLAEKQRRLLYLQQDTSGANAMEILRLQKEIEEGQEDYTDTLIDQKISELQDQNNEAAKQREQQITIAQAQLDHYIETGRIWNDVYSLMDEGLDKDTGLVRGSRLEEILKSAEGYKGMSEIAKMEWMNDTNNMIAQALAYLEIGRQLEDIGTQAGSQIEFTTSDGRVLTGTVNDDGSVTASDGQTYNNVFQGYDGKYYAGENIADVQEPVVEGATNNQSGSSSSGSTSKKSNPYGTASNQGNYYYAKNRQTIWGGNAVKSIQWALNDMGYSPGEIDGGYGYNTYSAVKRFQSAEGISADGDYGPQTREKMRLRGYKTGGLADFTGPAWLDGTKARPELVLNAKDTQNFIQLKDILASIMDRGFTSNTSTENNGDITYDIDINVESIGSDYDIEQVANKIKSMIGENARYRNNNTVSLAR